MGLIYEIYIIVDYLQKLIFFLIIHNFSYWLCSENKSNRLIAIRLSLVNRTQYQRALLTSRLRWNTAKSTQPSLLECGRQLAQFTHTTSANRQSNTRHLNEARLGSSADLPADLRHIKHHRISAKLDLHWESHTPDPQTHEWY